MKIEKLSEIDIDRIIRSALTEISKQRKEPVQGPQKGDESPNENHQKKS